MIAKCGTKPDLFGSIDYLEHLEARELCTTCPLIDTCRPGPQDNLADGTYGGRMWINGRIKPVTWSGRYNARPRSPAKPTSSAGPTTGDTRVVKAAKNCDVCGSAFTSKTNTVTCSPICRQTRQRQKWREKEDRRRTSPRSKVA